VKNINTPSIQEPSEFNKNKTRIIMIFSDIEDSNSVYHNT